MNLVTDSHQTEQWIILGIFFGLFFLAGLFNRPRARQLEYYQFMLYGFLTVLVNVGILFALNKNGIEQHNIFQALMLKDLALSTSFIAFGYCLMWRGLGQFIRLQFRPRNSYSNIL